MLDYSIMDTGFQLFFRDAIRFNRLFDAVLVSPPWLALVSMALYSYDPDVVYDDSCSFRSHGMSSVAVL